MTEELQGELKKSIDRLVKEISLTIRIRPRLLNVEQAAVYLSISPKTIRNGIGPKAPDPFPVKPKRAGKRVLFDIKDLDAYIDSMTGE